MKNYSYPSCAVSNSTRPDWAPSDDLLYWLESLSNRYAASLLRSVGPLIESRRTHRIT